MDQQDPQQTQPLTYVPPNYPLNYQDNPTHIALLPPGSQEYCPYPISAADKPMPPYNGQPDYQSMEPFQEADSSLSPKQILALRKARNLKIHTIIATVLMVLNYLALIWLLFLVPLPITGFVAGKKMSRNWTFAYIGAIALVIVARIIVMALNPMVILLVLFNIANGFEILNIIRGLLFAKILGALTPQELEVCRNYRKPLPQSTQLPS